MTAPDRKVDTHTHVVSADRTRYPIHPTGLGSQWWSEPERDAPALLRAMDSAGVHKALVVQPVGAYGYDCSYLIETAATWPDRLLAVPALDLDDEALGACELSTMTKRWADTGNVVGVRLFAVAGGSTWATDPERATAALRAIGDAGLVAVLTVFAQQLQGLLPVLEKRDSLVALDHCGFPELVDGEVPLEAPLMQAVNMPHVSLKVTSHLLHHAGTDGHPSRLVNGLLQHFGPERMMWGSDYPQSGPDYEGMLGAAAEAVHSLSDDEKIGFFGGNAARVFSIQ